LCSEVVDVRASQCCTARCLLQGVDHPRLFE